MKQMVAIVLSVVLLCTNIPVIADTYDEEEYYFLQEEDFSCVQSCLIDEHLYYRFDNEVEWDEARAFCESVGGHLMTIDNGMEETAVKKMLGSESYMMEAYWLGAKTDANSGAGYKWIGNETGTDLLDCKVEKGLAVNNESSIGEMGEKMLLRMNGEQAEGSRLKIGFICEWDDGNNISRYGSTESNEGEFSFLATQSTENKESKDITGYYFFEDAYFEQDAREYNPSLATMSLCLALSAFNSAKGTAYGNVKKLLEENQFYNIHVNDGYLNKPGQDTIGVAIAKRNDERISMWELQSEEEETEPYTLLAVAIRGGGYGKEWCSNVKMGTSGEHQGFGEARDVVLKELKTYIEENEIKGKIKLWITGYSRASAVANLTAAQIDRELNLGQEVTIAASDIYAYCFEVPMGAFETEKDDADYSNIFNIINLSDIVTYVAPSRLGFRRYGYDVVLPAQENDSEYFKKYDRMTQCLKNVDSSIVSKVNEFKNQRIEKKSIRVD